MKFKALQGQNFLTLFGTFKVRLDDRGLNLIQGLNEDDSSASSNGSGKSSLVDAICWVLFGTTARGAKGDAVVNRRAKKGTLVSLDMQEGAITYRASRYRKHAEHKNQLQLVAIMDDGRTVDMTKGTDAETQKEVERVLGCSEEVFKAAVYSGQEIMPDLPRMTDREIKRLVEEAAGLQRIERAYEIARERKIAAERVWELDKAAVGTAETLLARTDGDLEGIRRSVAEWDAQRDERVRATDTSLTRVQDDLREQALAAMIMKPVAAAATARIAEIDVALSEHSLCARNAREMAATATSAERAVEHHTLKTEQQRLDQANAQIADVDAEMAKPCPECGKPHTEADREEYLAHRTKFRDEQAARVEVAKVRVRAQLETLRDARAAAETAAAKVPDVTALVSERATHAKTIEHMSALLRRVDQLKADRDALREQKALRESEPNPLAKTLDKLSEGRTAAAAQLVAARETAAKSEQALRLAESVVKVFGPAGVRAEILDTVTPFLNARTAEYLGVLSDGNISAVWTTLSKSASGDLKEKFSIEVTHAKGGDSFALISGGEKRKVRLATALALQDLVASRAAKPIDLWIGDEIDDALDPAGLERLMVILDLKTREHGTVLVISHSDLRDWVDNVTVVRKTEPWTSTVEGALTE